MIVGHIGGSSSGGYEIQKSLRFRANASAYLSHTFGTASLGATFSFWVKRGALGSVQSLFGYSNGSTESFNIIFDASDKIDFFSYSSGYNARRQTTQVFRDTSAWYHIVCVVDSANATALDRVRVYVNGSRVTAFDATVNQVQNQTLNLTQGTWSWGVGRTGGTANQYLDGYVSEYNFIDGQALDPSYFGEVSAETGAWIPKKYAGTYGTNGFYLPFNDGSNLTNLTADRSGNGNNWTANNISLTSGATYDWMDDTPTNNFAVLNPLNQSIVGVSSASLSAGNLQLNSGGGANALGGYYSTISANTPLYCEMQPALINASVDLGIAIAGHRNAPTYLTPSIYLACLSGSSAIYINNSLYASGLAAVTTSDVLGMSFDPSAGALKFYKNGVQLGPDLYTAIDGYCVVAHAVTNGAGYGSVCHVNFGQRPFAYSPPAGFKALCTKNLPTPSILNPKKHFDVVLATGANIKSTAEAVFPSNFLEWIKDRGNANNHQLVDIVRGTSAVLQSNTTAAETTYSAPSGSSVGWLWKAGGAPATNNAGSIQSQVSANPQAGFSIVSYSSAAGVTTGTIGHGLGVVPKLILIKVRNAPNNWIAWHSTFTNNEWIWMTTTAKGAASGGWNSTLPTSSVFSVGNAASGNTWSDIAGYNYVAYCFAEIPGYSKIGSYTGNGSADNAFVYCGFRPAYVLIKCSSTTGNWVVIDCKRAGYNVDNDPLYANLSNAEATTDLIDITSNGFKVRSTNADVGAAQTYIFAAFAEQPFQFANAR